MNEKTEILIRELAEKFGTTGEHLWRVLVRQAPITGTIDALIIAAWVLFVVWAFRWITAKTTEPEPTDEKPYPRAEWTNESAFLAWVIWAVLTVFIVIQIGYALSLTISALVNPEYWALKQLLQ